MSNNSKTFILLHCPVYDWQLVLTHTKSLLTDEPCRCHSSIVSHLSSIHFSWCPPILVFLQPHSPSYLSVTLSLLVSTLSVWLPVCLDLCRINASVWRSKLILEVTQAHMDKLKLSWSIQSPTARPTLCWLSAPDAFIPKKNQPVIQSIAVVMCFSLQWTTGCLLQFRPNKEKSMHIWSAFRWESPPVPRWQGLTKLCFLGFFLR